MKPLRERLLDVATVLLIVGAIGVYGYRMLEGRRTTSSATADDERALLAAHPDTLVGILVSDTAKRVRVDFRVDSSTMVVLFSTSCHWCKQSVPVWETTAAGLPAHWRVVAITSEPVNEATRTFFRSSRFVVVRATSPASLHRVFPATGVPVTLAVRNGRVRGAQAGFHEAAAIDALLATLPR